MLISYALEPAVSWLARHRLPRIAGSSLVMLVLLGAGAGGAYVLRDDAVQALEAVPRATQRAREAVLSRVGLGREALEQVMGESGMTSRAAPGGSDPGEGASDRAPAPFVQRAAGAIVAFAADLVVIFFLLFFLLISGPYIRDRLIEIAGPTDERRLKTARFSTRSTRRPQRYLLVLLIDRDTRRPFREAGHTCRWCGRAVPRPAPRPRHVECLRRGDFVDQVEAYEQLVLAAGEAMHRMRLPNLLLKSSRMEKRIVTRGCAGDAPPHVRPWEALAAVSTRTAPPAPAARAG